MESYIWLIPVLPLAAFLITLIFGKWWIKEQAHWLPILAMAGSFGLSIAAFVQIRGAEEPVVVDLWKLVLGGQLPGAVRASRWTS